MPCVSGPARIQNRLEEMRDLNSFDDGRNVYGPMVNTASSLFSKIRS